MSNQKFKSSYNYQKLMRLQFGEKKLNLAILTWAIVTTIILMYYYYIHGSHHKAGTGFGSANCPYKWNGGSPLFKGSCWCGWDDYCMCTPSLAIDAIIELSSSDDATEQEPSIILIQRRDPPKNIYAIPGGFVDIGETVEEATKREAKEETNIDIKLESISQFHVYSDPKRDKRRHTVSAVMRCVINKNDIVSIRRGDDAKQVEIVPLRKAISLPLAFDHRKILTDYIARYHPSISNI